VIELLQLPAQRMCQCARKHVRCSACQFIDTVDDSQVEASLPNEFIRMSQTR